MKRLWQAAAAAALLAFCPFPVQAVNGLPGMIQQKGRPGEIVLGGPVTLNADTLSYDENTGVALAEGNVEISFGNRTINADRISYDPRTGEADIAGRVHYKDMGDEFSFDRIVINIESEQGVMYNGFIRLSSNNYSIRSEKFEKIGDRTFRIQKGSLTTCPCETEPDWRFDVRRSEVTIDGYATAKDVTFRVRGVPVIWLPWAAFPVKLTRQSGFLLPNFTSDQTRGFSFQLPYYWAINKWSDATLTLEQMSRRGFKPELEYRFVLNPASEGEARFSAHRDKETGDDRHRAYGKNIYHNTFGMTANAKWDFASDDQYYVDLVEDDILRTGRHIPSRGFAGMGTDGMQGTVSATWVKDVQSIPDDNTVQRVPEAAVTFLPRPVGVLGVDAAGDVAATYFYRQIDDRELRGRGYAELSRAFPVYRSVTATTFLFLDFLGSYPASDVIGTQSSGRAVPGGGARLEADLRKAYDTRDGRKIVHLVQPDVSFRYVPEVEQKDIPLTDQWSRVAEQQQFVFAVTQRFLRVDNVTGPSEMAFLALEWALDTGRRKPSGSPYLDPLSPFVRTMRDQIDIAAGRVVRQREAASDILARFQVRPSPPWTLTGETLYDTGDGAFTLAAVGGAWKRDEENLAQIEYRISRDLTEDIHGRFDVRPVRPVGFQTGVDYSFNDKRLTAGKLAVVLFPRSDCWSVGFSVTKRTNPDDTSYKLLFALKGIGSLGK